MSEENNRILIECDIDGKDGMEIQVSDTDLIVFKSFVKGDPVSAIYLNDENARKLRDFLNRKLGSHC